MYELYLGSTYRHDRRKRQIRRRHPEDFGRGQCGRPPSLCAILACPWQRISPTGRELEKRGLTWLFSPCSTPSLVFFGSDRYTPIALNLFVFKYTLLLMFSIDPKSTQTNQPFLLVNLKI